MREKLALLNDVKPHGHVKIELFDGLTGRKVDEREKDNFISRFILDHYLRYKMMDTLTQSRYTSTDYPQDNVSDFFNDPFRWVVLTDATHAENPLEEWVPRGNIIGNAMTTSSYSGSDPIRGSINRAESFSQMGHLRMVFDWATNTGNGTFQSVYFCPQSSYATSSEDYFDVLDVSSYSSFKALLEYNNKYYILGGDVIDRYDLNFNHEASFTLDSSYDDFAIRGDQFLLLSRSPGSVHEVPIATPDDTATKLFDTSSDYGLDYDPENQEFHLADGDGIAIYDSNYQLKDKVEVDGNMFVSPLFYLGYGWANYQSYIDIGGTQTHNFGTRARGITGDHFFCEDYNKLKQVPKFGIGSRALLDNPVTKTSNVTMKVTYDFMYE